MRVENSKIPRYNIVFLKRRKYLIDLNTYLKVCLLPLGTWYFKNDAMIINEEEYRKLRILGEDHTKSGGKSIAAMTLGGALYGFIKTIEGDSVNHLSIIKLIAILMISYMFVILVRDFTSKSDSERLKKLIGRENLAFDYVIFIKKGSSPVHRKKYLKKLIGQIILYIFLITLYLYAKTVTMIIVIWIFEAVRLSKQTGVLKPDENSKLECEAKSN